MLIRLLLSYIVINKIMKSFKLNNRNIHIHLNDISDDLNFGDIIAIDTETTGLSLVRDKLCLIQICTEKKDFHIIQFNNDFYNNPEIAKNLSNMLSNQNIEKIFHYARFDLSMLKKYFKSTCDGKIFCTKIASRLVRTYTDRHGLKELCKDLMNVDLNKSQQTTDWASSALTDEQLKYAIGDVLYLHDLRNKLILMLKRENRYELARNIFDFLDTRTDLDLTGWFSEDIFSHSI